MWNKARKLVQRLGGRRVTLAALPMRESFVARVQAARLELDSLPAEAAVRLMLDWYATERISGCDASDNGDMLLYQWGERYGDGCFYFDITRQFMASGGEDEDIHQLSLTLSYDVPAASLGIQDGNRWCESPDDAADFRDFVEASPAFYAVQGRLPLSVE